MARSSKARRGTFPLNGGGTVSARPSFTPQQTARFSSAPFLAPRGLSPTRRPGSTKCRSIKCRMARRDSARRHRPPGHESPYPPQVPDLIGVKDRKYLDHTGLSSSSLDRRHDALCRAEPGRRQSWRATAASSPRREISAPCPTRQHRGRYSDEQLYALALYIYSLKPPANPNKFDAPGGARAEDLCPRRLCRLSHAAALHQQQTDARRRIPGPAGPPRRTTTFCRSRSAPIRSWRSRRDGARAITRCRR